MFVQSIVIQHQIVFKCLECYNCQGEGHSSRDCTEPRKERPPRSDSGFGGGSRGPMSKLIFIGFSIDFFSSRIRQFRTGGKFYFVQTVVCGKSSNLNTNSRYRISSISAPEVLF